MAQQWPELQDICLLLSLGEGHLPRVAMGKVLLNFVALRDGSLQGSLVLGMGERLESKLL